MGYTENCSGSKACVSDYVAIAITAITSIIIALGICFLWLRRRTPEVKAKQVSLLVVQAFGSILWLIALLMTKYVIRTGHYGNWFSCYLWNVWMGVPLSYCLVVSCHVARANRLYHVFVRRRLPPLRARHLVPLLLIPSLCTAAVVQWRKPFQHVRSGDFISRFCSGPGSTAWWLVISGVNFFYIFMLIISTWMVRNIRFEFNESKELLASVVLSLIFFGVWLALLFVSQYHKNSHRKDVFLTTAQYLFLFLGSATALCFAFFPVLRPLKAYLGYMKKQNDLDSMGLVLGVPNSGLLQPFWSFRFDEPLEALLQHRRFREAFQEFSDSRMAGEVVRFYVEVRELSRMSSTNTVARIYMAQHIIETFIDIGSPMEINISCAMRSDILLTKDLSNPKLFDQASIEALKIMKLNLEQDFRQSAYFREMQNEMESENEFAEQLEWMNVSSKRDSFSNSDNLFESKGSPHWPLRLGSPSPTRNGTVSLSPTGTSALSPTGTFNLSPNAALSPEHIVSNMDSHGTLGSSMQNFQEALRHLTHHRQSKGDK